MASFNSRRRNFRTEIIEVPSNACGLIVGSKGRNIKELQQLNGIKYINVDFTASAVKVVGTDADILIVKRRINHAVSLAVNAAGYFPQNSMTCLRLQSYENILIFFSRVSSNHGQSDYGGCIRIEQLDKQREYFVIRTVPDTTTSATISSRFASLTLDTSTEEEQLSHKDTIISHYKLSSFREFIGNTIQSNLSCFSGKAAYPKIYVHFGKTFLSSIPPEVQGRKISTSKFSTLKYGKYGIRPEFVRHFSRNMRSGLLRATRGNYELLSYENVIVVHCVSQRTKKRYAIKLRHHPEDSNVDSLDEEDTLADPDLIIRQIGEAKDYFAVLGVPENASSRDIKVAYQFKAKRVHPDKNSNEMAGKAMTVLNEARECLLNPQSKSTYMSLPSCSKKPKNAFVPSTASSSRKICFPDLISCHRKDQRLALFTILSEAKRSEFRTTIEIEQNEAMSLSMRYKLQEAWDNRTEDDKFQFSSDADHRKDWLIVDGVRYKKRTTLTNGTFKLMLDEATEDHFGKSYDGIHITLSSIDVADMFENWNSSFENDNRSKISRLVSYTCDLQEEASRISSLLDSL